MVDIKSLISFRIAGAKAPPDWSPDLPDQEDEPPAEALPELSIAGHNCIVTYVDSRGRPSTRQLTCTRLEDLQGVQYLFAWCLHRKAHRRFRLDRISEVSDAVSGETLGDGSSYFARFGQWHVQDAPLHWGLSPCHHADLRAGLIVLMFMARCDGEVHEAELEVVEQLVTSFWLRCETLADLPLNEIRAAADRIAPDSESFFVALERARQSQALTRIIVPYLERVMVADGRLHAHELHWMRAAIDYLSQA
ncbi:MULTISPECIES: WYL domain-containing protein [Sphingomonadales]|uniref:tellurite resistance TerB family protein n=1 Tax=Sphingomonadales TaxID=204457 RepID=UPI0008264D56|nr:MULTISPECIES: WYL domain-containing protein [Sphingomonadales]